jgi:hypothetical protein
MESGIGDWTIATPEKKNSLLEVLGGTSADLKYLEQKMKVLAVAVFMSLVVGIFGQSEDQAACFLSAPLSNPTLGQQLFQDCNGVVDFLTQVRISDFFLSVYY